MDKMFTQTAVMQYASVGISAAGLLSAIVFCAFKCCRGRGQRAQRGALQDNTVTSSSILVDMETGLGASAATNTSRSSSSEEEITSLFCSGKVKRR